MSDPELVREIVANILTAIERIERRFAGIDNPEDFISDDEGIDRLDGITMMLIAIGEQVKRLDRVVEIDWTCDIQRLTGKGSKALVTFSATIISWWTPRLSSMSVKTSLPV